MECIFSNVFRGGDFLRILTVLSDLMVPLLIFYVVGLGLLMKQDVFGDFLNGAKDGMRTVIGIVRYGSENFKCRVTRIASSGSPSRV